MFAAVIMRASRAAPQSLGAGADLLKALTPFTPPDLSGVWHDPRALMVQAIWHNTPESQHEQAPETCADTGRVIVSWVRLDNREALCAQLGLTEAVTLSDPQIILAAHRHWGSQCADRLEGDFSFVIYDPARHSAFCARDGLGAKPFYYLLNDSCFVASTSVAGLRALPGLALSPDQGWMALFALGMNVAHDQAAYDGVRKLPPAHALEIGPETATGPQAYFQFDPSAPHARHRDPKWVTQYRAAFERAVQVRARSAYLVGAESSAGLDSSSIVAQLSQVLPHARDDLHCFGMMIFEHEPELMLLTAAHCDLRHTHIVMRPPMHRIDATFQRALTALGHPPEHGQILYHPSFFEQSQALGLRSLMSGFGGDEMVTGYASHLMEELWARGAYGVALRELPGRLPMRLARFGKLVLRGPPDPFAKSRRIVEGKLALSCLRREVLEDLGLRQKLQAMAAPQDAGPTLNMRALSDPAFRYALPARLESAAVFAASYGMEYRWPLLDRGLIAQYLATPSIEKRHRGMGRYLHRRALQGRVPERILWQRTKAMGGYLGGGLEVEAGADIRFSELPEKLRVLLDENKLAERQQRLKQGDTPVNQQQGVIWQIRQLAAWLDA